MGQEGSKESNKDSEFLDLNPVDNDLESDNEVSIQVLVDSLRNPNQNDESLLLLKNKTKVKEMIDKLDSYGYNLLHRAIIAGNDKLVSDFINYDANLNIVTKYDHTPLELALHHKQNDIALQIWDKLKSNPIIRITIIPWYKLIWLKLMSAT